MNRLGRACPSRLPNNGGAGVRVSFEQFYAAVGRAQSSWGMVEEKVFDVFARVTICSINGSMKARPEALWTVGTIYHSASNFVGKLAMIDALIKRLVSEDALRREWKRLKKATSDLSEKRNILAHGMVFGNQDTGADCLAYPVLKQSPASLTFEETAALEGEFRRLASDLENLAVLLNQHLVARAKGGPQ
jgi:hypothetical protein